MKTYTTKMEETQTMGKGTTPVAETTRFRFEYNPELIFNGGHSLEGMEFRYIENRGVFRSGPPAMLKFRYDREIMSQNNYLQVRNDSAGRDVYYQRYDRNVATLVLAHSVDGVDDGVNCEKEYPATIEAEEVANGIGNRLAGMGYSTLIEKMGGGHHISGRQILEKGGVMTRVQDVDVNLIPKRDGVVSARIHIEKATYYDNSHIEGHGVTKEVDTTPLSEINKVAELVNGAFSLTEHGYKQVEVASK